MNGQFSDGETALPCALRLDSYLKCKILLDNGADCSIQWNEQNALEYAIANSCSSKIITELFERYDIADLPGMLFENSFVDESTASCIKRLGVHERDIVRHCDGVDFSVTSQFMQVMKSNTNSKLFSNDCYKQSASTAASTFAFPQQCPETHEIKSCTEEFFRCFQSYFNNHPQQPNSLTIHLTGSMAEGTKAYLPNEFDAVCEMPWLY